jgi:anti-anti-sigma regulatory factor
MDPGVLDRLGAGDHVCRMYDDEDERMATVAQFVQTGVRSDHKVVFYSLQSPREVLEELKARGIDAGELSERGRLEVAAMQDGYLGSGMFDPVSTIEGWRKLIAEARAEGYAGLWAIGDMSWAAGRVSGAERVYWYEAEINRLFAGGDALAMCLYDQRLFPGDALDRLAAAHPSTLEPGDDETWLPLLRMRRTPEPPGLKLIGEADASNRTALDVTLAGLAEDLPATVEPLTLDLTELHFADAAVGRLLIQAAHTLPTGLRIVGCPASVARLLTLLGGDWIPGVRDIGLAGPDAAAPGRRPDATA